MQTPLVPAPCCFVNSLLLATLILALLTGAAEPETEVQPDHNRGVYAIWARPDQIAGLDFVNGRQIYLQWRDLQTGPDQYNFGKLEAAMKKMAEAKTPATVQVNGNRKPEFLYTSVPRISEKLSRQISDARGSLMYWHPNHRDAYLAFVAAYGEHIRQSPHRDAILGVRLNFNALGTEHMHVPKAYHQASQWQTPAGVSSGPDWSRDIMTDYKHLVVDAFIKAFRPHTRVFVRNNVVLDEPIHPDIARGLDTGELAVFHTSSEVQPRSSSTERRYRAFLRWARSGKTVAYAESWASAWGDHGGIRDDHWCSPCQWNYWRLLVDLHCGVSFIAVYGADLQAAKTDPEFAAAFAFAKRYAGLHASPSKAPGAWVAMREGEFLRGDYTFLMERLKDSVESVRLVGPSDQRHGAWALRIPSAGRMRFRVDRRFLKARIEESLHLRVVYLDQGEDQFDIGTGQWQQSRQLTNSGRWKTAEWSIPASEIPLDSDHHLEIRTADTPITFHMVELTNRE